MYIPTYFDHISKDTQYVNNWTQVKFYPHLKKVDCLTTLQIVTAKLQLYYDKKDVLWIFLWQLVVYQNLPYPYFLKVIFSTTDCHRKYDF